MRNKTTKCYICQCEDIKLHGRICNKCDYKRRKEYFKKRAEERKKEGYYIGKKQSKDYVKAREYYGEKCMRCGYDEEPILEVHHKDKNRKNHNLDNLIVFCPNCHQLLHFQEQTGRYHKNSRI